MSDRSGVVPPIPEEARAPEIYRLGQLDALKAVLARARSGATGRALLLWVGEQYSDLKDSDWTIAADFPTAERISRLAVVQELRFQADGFERDAANASSEQAFVYRDVANELRGRAGELEAGYDWMAPTQIRRPFTLDDE